MKTLEEMIEHQKVLLKVAKEAIPGHVFYHKTLVSLLLELKQRREQDLTLDMVRFLKDQPCCETLLCEECSVKALCNKTTDWLNKQEVRLKGS